MDGKVSEVVDHVVVQATIGFENDIIELTSPAHATVGATSSGSVDKSACEARCTRIDGKASAAGSEETAFVLSRLWEVVPHIDLVANVLV